jgi:hypothetical protein
MEEHRYHRRLRKYWDGLRGENPFPRENQINPDDLEDIWSSCFLISIDDVTRRVGYRYSYMGQELVAAYGDDLTFPDITQNLISTAKAPMAEKFDEVVREGKPMIDESQFVNSKNVSIRYRSCILPLGTAEGTVTHILGCMRWKIY